MADRKAYFAAYYTRRPALTAEQKERRRRYEARERHEGSRARNILSPWGAIWLL
jgi:hypothetical protein